MKYIKSIYESENSNIIEKILSYITNKANIQFFKYGGDIKLYRDGKDYKSILYLTLYGSAIRFNYISNVLSSIDMWKVYSFNSDTADYTMELYTYSIQKILNDIYLFFISNTETVLKEELETKDNDKDFDIHVGKKETHNYLVGKSLYKIKTFDNEKSKSEHDKIYKDDDIDIFKAIELSTLQLMHGSSRFLLITGDGGFGKTTTVENTLKDHNKKFYSAAGSITESALYELLFNNRHKGDIILLDDCDSYWDSDDMINILKAATDTKAERYISRIAKTYYDPANMTDEQIQEHYIKTKKLPKKFKFDASIICITNISQEELLYSDIKTKKVNKKTAPFLTRGIHLDVRLNRKQALDKIRSVMINMPDISNKIKDEALQYLIFIVDNYKTKAQLNIRTYIHTLNTRLSNDFPINVNGENIPAWKLLVKKYLVM